MERWEKSLKSIDEGADKGYSEREHARLVRAVARRTKSDWDRAEDALQQAWVELLTQPEPVQNRAGFLFSRAVRRVWDRLKHETFIPDAGRVDDLRPHDRGAGDPARQFGGETDAPVLRDLAHGWGISEVAREYGLSRRRVREIKDGWAGGLTK